ncbi:toll/interleukin-1 receptor domain-containing protein [Streptomyces sp. NPDC046909]|uniref:toll/interleukin-1 receptor domain-containing protein n=1 Tax=Streptomyces sp. NPDC046909 TaxID=3155617 RepID=UPI0034068722
MNESDGAVGDRPERGWQSDIVEAVLRTDVFADQHARALLRWLIDAELAHPLPAEDIGDHVTALLQCVRLVRHCARLPGGLPALASVIGLLEPDGASARQVMGLVEARDTRRPCTAAPDGTATAEAPSAPVTPGVLRDSGRDFFLSYSGSDQRWAVWIAWELEEAGFSVLVQEWDFVPGSNWQDGREKGVGECERVVAVLSPAYLESVYERLEWQTAQGSDPAGFARRLVPVRIAPCRPRGLLAALVFIDLVGLNVTQARERLLSGMTGVLAGRSKPTVPPEFPP